MVEESREINIEGQIVEIFQRDILVLSPSTFSTPDKLEYGKITEVNNPDSDVEKDGEYFQIRTDKHAWDFRNHFKIMSVLRPSLKGDVVELDKIY